MSGHYLPGPLRIGERYKNKYDILELLGAGGQGAVYRAHHCLKKQDVAIKVVAGRDPEAMLRGAREAESLARLNHPNIPGLFDAEIDDGFLLLVMEYLKGRPYKAALKEHGRLGVQEVLELSIQAAEALAFMHEQGVVHRDVKPENIYIASGNQVKILDFGIAKVEDEKAKTQRNIILGTRPYVAPEQLQGHPVSHYSDQFALGVVEYIALCGVHPTDQVLLARGETPNAQNRMEVQCLVMPAPLHQLDPEIALYVSRVVQRSIAKQPSQRFASMRDKADALRECLRLSLQDKAHSRRRPVVRDLSVPGSVPLVRPSAERKPAGRAQPQLESERIRTERDPQPPASLQPRGAGYTEPLAPLAVQPARQVTAVSWITGEQYEAFPDRNLYGPKGTLRVAPPPVAKLWTAEMLAPEKAHASPAPPAQPENAGRFQHVLAEIPGRSKASAGSAALVREAQVALPGARSAPLAAKGIRRFPEEKPRTPPPVTVGLGKHPIRWSSVRPLLAIGLGIGTATTSLMVAVLWGISWIGHRAPARATASPSQVIVESVTQEAPEAPALPSPSIAPRPTAQVPLPAATTLPAPVVSNSQLTKAAPTGIASSTSKPPAALSSSQRAHQSDVARMRERMNELEKDLKDSKGANLLW